MGETMTRKEIEKQAHNWEFEYVDKLDDATEFAIEISNAQIETCIERLKVRQDESDPIFAICYLNAIRELQSLKIV